MERHQLPADYNALLRWIELAPWPIHLIDASGHPHHPNPELGYLLGYHGDQFDRSTLHSCMPRATRCLLNQVVASPHGGADTDGSYIERALVYRHRDGSDIDVRRARIGPLTTPDQPVAVMLADVASSPILSRAEVQARFAHLVAHDLNNVFTIAHSYIDLARRQAPDEPLIEEYLERAAHAVRRGICIGDQLHTVADVHREFPIDRHDVGEVIDSLRPFLQRLLMPGPQWSLVSRPRLPLVLTHPVYLARFLIDLCVNAHLRWPQSPTLAMETRPAPTGDAAILIRITPQDQAAVCTALPYRPILCRGARTSPGPVESALIDGVIHHQPISIDTGEDALTALVPAIEDHRDHGEPRR